MSSRVRHPIGPHVQAPAVTTLRIRTRLRVSDAYEAVIVAREPIWGGSPERIWPSAAGLGWTTVRRCGRSASGPSPRSPPRAGRGRSPRPPTTPMPPPGAISCASERILPKGDRCSGGQDRTLLPLGQRALGTARRQSGTQAEVRLPLGVGTGHEAAAVAAPAVAPGRSGKSFLPITPPEDRSHVVR